MCTIVLLSRVHPTFPLIVAANRDELYARETLGPQVLAETPRAVGGLDAKEGGTWMGANEHGLFAGLTNQRTHAPPDERLRSRGHVVRAVLEASSPEEARARIERLEPAEYNSFNLLFGNAQEIFVAYSRNRPPTLDVEEVRAGISVLPNDRMGSPEFPKSERAIELAEALVREPWPALVERLRAMLGDHELPAADKVPEPPPRSFLPASALRQLQALCVHTPHYGTRSATVLALQPDRVAHYLYADGPPCSTEFRDYTSLLEQS